jgi:hypothetical protein
MDNSLLDAYLDLLSDSQRRAVLREMHHAPADSITFEQLVERFSESDSDQLLGDGGSETNADERVGIATQLHHTHLPKLDAHDIVEYDPDAGHIEYDPPEEFEEVLELLPAQKERRRA